MSGAPNLTDVTELRAALADVAKEDEAIRLAENNRDHAAFCISQAQQRRTTAQKRAQSLMERMDCVAPGNAGYSQRLAALLTQLSAVAEEFGRRDR